MIESHAMQEEPPEYPQPREFPVQSEIEPPGIEEHGVHVLESMSNPQPDMGHVRG